MSKSGNGDIVGIDPAAIEAAFALPDTTTSFEDVAIAAPQQIQNAPASGLSPVEQFYGSSDRITQPDAGYYDEFPLPGSAPAAPAPAPTPAPLPIFDPVFDPAVPDYRTGPAVDFGLPNIETFDEGLDFLRQQFMPDPSMFQINTGYDPIDDRQLELPTYQQFDPTALQNEITDLRSQIGLLGQAPTPGFQQTTAYAPILDFAAR